MQKKIFSKSFILFLKMSFILLLILGGFFIFGQVTLAAETIDSFDLAIWHFDENSGAIAYDSTANHFDLSWGHNYWGGGRIIPERVAGRWDLGVYFNQYEEHFYTKISPSIEFPNGLTVGIWIKTDLASDHKARFFWLGDTLDQAGIPRNHFMLSVKNNQVYLDLKQGNVWQQELISHSIINDNEWHLVNAIFNPDSETIALFVDGQKQVASSFTLPVPAFERADIGYRECYGAAYNNFKGAVDDVWIKTESLTDAQIEQIYQSNRPYQGEIVLPPVAEVDVRAYYNFNDVSHNLAYDLSGNSYDLHWGYNPYSNGEPAPQPVPGRWGSAVIFKKLENNFYRNFSPPLDWPHGLVIGTWLKTTAFSNPAATILWFGNTFSSLNPDNYFAILEDQGKIKLYLGFKDGCDTTVYGPRCHHRRYELYSEKLINDGNWHFIAVVLDPRAFNHAIRLYIDGELDREEFFPDPIPAVEKLRVGYRLNNYADSSYNFDGDIDDLFILSSIITDDEVSQIYNSNKPFVWPLKLDPVIIVPGIMGSYLYMQDSEQIWPAIDNVIFDPWDLHLNKMILPENGEPSGNSILIPDDIFREIVNKDFFQGLIDELTNNGYQEGENLFVFPYDWRWDINWAGGIDPISQVQSLSEKVIEIKGQTGADKVNIIAHSMGGLIAKKYIKDYGSGLVNKFIDIGTPHLGAPKAFKILMYGDNLGFEFLGQSILHPNRAKIISQNFPSVYQLLPSQNYFDENNNDYSYYIYDMHDLDSNGITGRLDYEESIEFMKNTGRNEYLLGFNNSLHSEIDNYSPQQDNIATFNIIGCSQPTIGQIFVMNKDKSGKYEYGLKYINGDSTVPLRSAKFLESDKEYYINNTEHAYLPSTNGARQLIAAILKEEENLFDLNEYSNLGEDDSICSFSGTQISFHSPIELHVYDENNNHLGPNEDGDIEMGIVGAQYDIIEDNKFAFLPAGHSYRIVGKATDRGYFNARIQDIEDGQYIQTVYYNKIPIETTEAKAEFVVNNEQGDYTIQIDQDGDGEYEDVIQPSSILDEEKSQDLVKPQTNINISGTQNNKGWYITPVAIELTAQDNENGSGILKTEYSLDNGQTWINYDIPVIFNQKGEYTILYNSTDKAGNIEEIQEENIKITVISIDSTIADIGQGYEDGMIVKKIVKKWLIKKLEWIKKYIERYAKIQEKRDERFKKIIDKCAKKKGQEWCEQKFGPIFDKIIEKSDKIHKKIVLKKYKAILKQLKFYHKKRWIDDDGYAIIKQDIEHLINNL